MSYFKTQRIILFFLAMVAFAGPAWAVQPAVATYDQLLSAIRETRAASQLRIEQAVAQEKVREAWETGKLIDEHVLLHKERADYGEQVLKKLANDLETSETELRYMLQFARAYPIHPPGDELSWSHYRALLAMNDPDERKEVTAQAVREHWNRDQVRAEVRRRKANGGSPEEEPEKLVAEPGKVGTYRIVKAETRPYKGQLVIDLGFSNYLSLGIGMFFPRRWPQESRKGRRGVTDFKEGDFIKTVTSRSGLVTQNQNWQLVTSDESRVTDLFTYKVYVTNVIDGDTFDAVIDLGFGITTKQKLRLRGLDAREIESAEGLEAKEYLEKALRGGEVVVRTVKSDKYDRYLADVFVGDRYINQELVQRGLATVVED